MRISKKIAEYGLIMFSMVWIFLIIADYVNKHPFYKFSYEYFRYSKLALFVIILTGITAYLIKSKPQFTRISATWPFLALYFFILQVTLCVSYSAYVVDLDLSIVHVLSFLGNVSFSVIALIGLSISAYLYGDRLKIGFLKEGIFKIGLGLIIISLLIFLISALNFYNFWVGIAILVLPVLLSYKTIPDLLRSIFVRSYALPGLNYLGIFSIGFMLFFLGLNFSYSQSPFPIGFDSRNFYMNIARQVSLQEGLIFGYRPYGWALVMSLGYTVFKSSAVAVSISIYGLILSLFAMFKLATKALKINVNYTLFAMLMLTVTPAISNQQYIEHKTDLGLMFFQLLSLLFMVKIFRLKILGSVLQSKRMEIGVLKQHWLKFVVLGIVLGFGLSIKMTNLFLVFSLLLCLIWLMSDSLILVIGSFLLTIALMSLAGLDDLSGLKRYHLGLSNFLLVLIVTGAGLVGLAFIREKRKTLFALLTASFIGISSLVPLSPWLVKNIIETKSLNPSNVLNGAKTGPNLDFKTIDQNYKNSKSNG